MYSRDTGRGNSREGGGEGGGGTARAAQVVGWDLADARLIGAWPTPPPSLLLPLPMSLPYTGPARAAQAVGWAPAAGSLHRRALLLPLPMSLLYLLLPCTVAPPHSWGLVLAVALQRALRAREGRARVGQAPMSQCTVGTWVGATVGRGGGSGPSTNEPCVG